MIRLVLRRVWPSLALAALLLLTAVFFARACYFRDDICFFAEHAPARWIIYPLPIFGGTRPGVPLDAVFRRSFSLASVPAAATLDVRASRTATILLNGKVVPVGPASDHWKAESRCDAAAFLRAGSNDLTVTVTNASGPPALWLALSCPETVVVSDRVLAGVVGRRHVAAGGPGGRSDPVRQFRPRRRSGTSHSFGGESLASVADLRRHVGGHCLALRPMACRRRTVGKPRPWARNADRPASRPARRAARRDGIASEVP